MCRSARFYTIKLDSQIVGDAAFSVPRANTVRPYAWYITIGFAQNCKVARGAESSPPTEIAIHRWVCVKSDRARAGVEGLACRLGRASAYFRMQRSPPETRTPRPTTLRMTTKNGQPRGLSLRLHLLFMYIYCIIFNNIQNTDYI